MTQPAVGRGYDETMWRLGRLVATAAALAAFLTVPAQATGEHVIVATLDGVINPITQNYIDRATDRAVQGHANALIIALDTPGGLDTSMRGINKRILAAPLPVVVFVSPSGARAASAGLFITEAADVAVMAPGTNIGSAHPIILGGANPAPTRSPSAGGSEGDIASQKLENDAAAYIRALALTHNRNADWAEQAVRKSVNVHTEEAVRLHVVDFQSRDLSTLLQDLNGRTVSKGGQTYTLRTGQAAIERYDLTGFERLLVAVAEPDVAYLLLLLAIVAIGFWVTHPGFFLPGVVGVTAAILAALALYNLPINLAGVLLVLLAVVLFIVDLKAPTHGVLTTGGIIAMSLGGLLLIDTGFLAEGVNIALVLVTVLALGGAFAFVLRKILAARQRPFAAGREAMIGRLGIVREALSPDGLVFVEGALWRASSVSGPLQSGGQVRVVGVDGLRLKVEALRSEPSSGVGQQQAASN